MCCGFMIPLLYNTTGYCNISCANKKLLSEGHKRTFFSGFEISLFNTFRTALGSA
jgi:hypothetical protein